MRKPIPAVFTILCFALLAWGCNNSAEQNQSIKIDKASNTAFTAAQDTTGLAKAVFASGCFWCTEAVFERVAGVDVVNSGYAGGRQLNPTYQQVSAGKTDHAEAVIVYYDSTVVSYPTLLDIFFHSHDPTQLNRQGPDVGKQYRSAIFYRNKYQQQQAEQYLKQLENKREFKKPVVTELKPLTKFWVAEDYHQDYYRLNPDDPYIRAVSMPKVKKFEKEYRQYLKEPFQQ